MKNVKIFATPEAYDYISEADKRKDVQEVIQKAIELSLDDNSRSGGYASANCPIGFEAHWSCLPSGDSIILIYKTNGLPVIPCLPDMLEESLKTAIPISLV